MPLLTRFGGARSYGIFSAIPILPGGFITGRDNSVTHKMAYSTETISVLSWSRTTGGNSPVGLGNADVAGYIMNSTSSEKILFESDTKAASAPTLSSNRDAAGSASNSGSFGYAMGGYDSNAGGGVTTTDKFTYSSDTRTTLGTGISSSRYGVGGLGNRTVAAYAAGGYGGLTTVDKFSFSNDSRSTLGTGLSENKAYFGGVSNSGTAGYFPGGYVDNVTYGSANTNKYNYSNDSRSTLAATLPLGAWAMSVFHKQGVAGYLAGGINSPGNYAGLTTVVKLNFTNDSISTNASSLTAVTGFGVGVSNSI
jgi:hypothetical protein